MNTQDYAQVVNPILKTIVSNEILTCKNLHWRYYHSSFELHGLDPIQVYIYNDFPCMFYMNDFDTTNTDSYGMCEVDYTGIINWFFANGDDAFTFNWVIRYDDFPAYDTSHAIARFKHIFSNGENSYLWCFCNNTLEAVIESC